MIAVTKITIKDVAREAGVSTATISRVLNDSGYVHVDVRKHVLSVVQRMNYRPNAIARSLKQDKTSSIGIVIPDLTNPYFMQIARSIQHRCLEVGYHTMFMDTEENELKEQDALNFLMEQRVEALILAGTGGNIAQIERMRSLGIHVVLFDRKLPGLTADSVMENNRDLSADAIRRLIDKGHSRIGVIRGPQSLSTAEERYEGVRSGFESHGMALRETDIFGGDYSRASGMRAAQYFAALAEAPSAIFSSNNQMTFGFYLELQRQGIPLDSVEVVSFGDLEFASLFEHRLTMIRQKPNEIGDAVGEIVIKRLMGDNGPEEQRVFDPEFN
jgi:LacI family transcriptional regulator